MRCSAWGAIFVVIAAVGCRPSSVPPAEPAKATPDSGGLATEPALENGQDAEAPFVLEQDFTPLRLQDFLVFPADASTWSEAGDLLVSTGKPRGYLYTRDSYQNFTWRLECRFPRPADLKDETKFKGNTGFLVYITGEPKIWPLCLEVQGKHVQLGAIKENGGAEPPVVQDDHVVRESARRPVGEWNALEIVSRDGALQVSLNGVPVSGSEPNFLSSGQLGIQAEDHPFEIRRMRIRRDE